MLSTELTNIAEQLAADVRAGNAGRESITSKTVAFGWAEGTPPIVARFTESAQVDGMTFDAVRVKASGTPAAKVAEGGTKPKAITLESFAVTLPKYAGLAEFSLEASLSTVALLPAINATLVSQAMVAFDTDAVAALDTLHGSTASGTDWTTAILNGIAAVAGAGQNPNVLVIAPADYAAAVKDPGSAFSMDPASGITSLFGLALAVCVGATTGEAYVLDSRAAVAVENVNSPMFLLDPFTKADTNTARLISELVAAFVVTQPAGVCQITVTP